MISVLFHDDIPEPRYRERIFGVAVPGPDHVQVVRVGEIGLPCEAVPVGHYGPAVGGVVHDLDSPGSGIRPISPGRVQTRVCRWLIRTVPTPVWDMFWISGFAVAFPRLM